MNRKDAGRLAVVGIGNTLAGDDGAGIRVVERLKDRMGESCPPGVILCLLEGDLLSVTELLDQADHIIFVDAVAGSPPGTLVKSAAVARAFAPSFHQTDMGTLMARLETLGLREPFPTWEIRGITIDPPDELGEKLSPEVSEAVVLLADSLFREIIDS